MRVTDEVKQVPARPVIASMWIGQRLSYIEQLCLKSFADHGHRVKLYTYENDLNVPAGVELADARQILPELETIYSKVRQSPAASSDKFRYHLLAQTDEVWVDTDALCIRPFPKVDYFFAFEAPHSLANGIMRLPKESPTVSDLVEFTSTNYPSPPKGMNVFSRDFTPERFASLGGPGKVHINEFPWGTWGPRAFEFFARKNNELRFAIETDYLYPHGPSGGSLRFVVAGDRHIKISMSAYSVHLYTSHLRRRLIGRKMFVDNLPLRGSFLAQRLIDHDIDPRDAPLLPHVQA